VSIEYGETQNRIPAEMSITTLKYDKSISILFIFVILFALFFLFFNLGGRSLENRDHLRFAEVAREIVETGDWVMMRLGGDIYIHKPPLHFWNIALAFKSFGVGAFAARFPSALYGFLGFIVILVFGLGINSGNPKTGIYSALFLISNYTYSFFARTTRLEIEYTFLFSASLISFYMGYETCKRNKKIIFYLLFWVVLGLTFLEKGPVAFIILLIIAIYLLVKGRKPQVGWSSLGITLPAFVLTVLPWIILLVMHKDFESYLTLLKNIKIMTRSEGLFYYPLNFIQGFYPVAIFMIICLSFIWRWRDELNKHPRIIFCLVWIAVYTLLINLTAVKSIRYLLPVAMPFSIIAGWGMERIFNRGILNHNMLKQWKVMWVVLVAGVCVGPALWIFFHKGWMWNSFFLVIIGMCSAVFVWKRLNDAVVFICILCALWFLSKDLSRTMLNTERSENQRVYTKLQEHNIRPDELMLYKTDTGLKRALYFYYNSPVSQINDLTEIGGQVRAIVTSSEGHDEMIKFYGPSVDDIALRNHRGKGKKINHIIFPRYKGEASGGNYNDLNLKVTSNK